MISFNRNQKLQASLIQEQLEPFLDLTSEEPENIVFT